MLRHQVGCNTTPLSDLPELSKDKMCHRGSDVIRDGANLAGVTSNGLSGGSSSLNEMGILVKPGS